MFAQQGGFGGAQGAGPPDFAGMNTAIIAVYCVFLVVLLGVGILFLLTLQKCLSRIEPPNRTMEPGMVWLNLVPCFNIVWNFITVIRISESLEKEFRSRGMPVSGDYGRGIGLTFLICNLLGIIPFVGLVTGLIGLVCWIVYWVKIAGFSKELAEGPSFRDDYDRGDDYDRRFDADDDYGTNKPWRS
jgi:hypothetical protein